MNQLDALIATFGFPADTGESGEKQRRCVRLAERKRDALKAQLESQIAADIACINDLLKTAEKLSETDPIRSAQMIRAMVALYEGKSGLGEKLLEANALLRKWDATSVSNHNGGASGASP